MKPSSPRVRLRRSYRFSAAHHYFLADLPESENERLFGKCANRHGHGHNYRLEVTLAGEPAPRTGMLFDLAELDRVVRAAVLDPLDHRHLNHEVEYFATHLPTCENLARFIWQELAPRLPAGLLDSVWVHEADDLAAEYRGGA
jgi:6-pyruvoyltetrahydropterin/6-carboxytetrahydropterin synthase